MSFRGRSGRVDRQAPPSTSARARYRQPHITGSMRRAFKEARCTFLDCVVEKYATYTDQEFFPALRELSLASKRVSSETPLFGTRHRWDIDSRNLRFFIETHDRDGTPYARPVCIEIHFLTDSDEEKSA